LSPGTELSLIRALDVAPQVEWFCEQPAAIGYIFAGRHRTYYPDLLAATKDGYCILIEVKPRLDMPLAINQAKAAAARAFCARNGWGFLVTDLRRSLNGLLTMPVPEEASRRFADALRETGTMTWQDIKAHRARCGLTAVQVAALGHPARVVCQPVPVSNDRAATAGLKYGLVSVRPRCTSEVRPEGDRGRWQARPSTSAG